MTDPVERLGIERTRLHTGDSDLVIAVFDSSRPLDSDDDAVLALCANRRGVAILNKRDLSPSTTPKCCATAAFISRWWNSPL